MNKRADQTLQDMELDEIERETTRRSKRQRISNSLTKGYIPPKKKKYHGQEEEVTRIKKRK